MLTHEQAKRGIDMREIKFRAWYNDKELLDVDTIFFDGDKFFVYLKKGDVRFGQGNCPVILEQFTGLYDSTKWEELTELEREDWVIQGNMPSEWTGKKIYEGDIVFVGNSWNENAVIIYDKDISAFVAQFKKWGNKRISKNADFEIIGTIHDNPELLEVTE